MTVNVDAIVQFRIRDPVASIKYVNDVLHATRLLAQTTLRNSLGAHTLSEILSSKDTIQNQMRVREQGSGGKIAGGLQNTTSNVSLCAYVMKSQFFLVGRAG